MAVVLRIHNAVHYNPYWGYDGGAHLAYIEILADEARLPTMEETYVAWHEPLYYVVMAGLWSVVQPFVQDMRGIWEALSLAQAALGAAFVVLSYVWARVAVPHNRFVHYNTALIASVLPGSLFLSSYLTNELVLQAGMLGVLWFVIYGGLRRRKVHRLSFAFIMGGISGLLILTKLTALVLIAAIVLWLWLGAWRTHSFKLFRNGAIIFTIAAVMALPWYLYKDHVYGTVLTINNYEQIFYAQEERVLPDNFFTSFDTSIFHHPFWDTGDSSFWTILYADTFGDYYGIFHNPDAIVLLPEADRMTLTSGQHVSKRQATLIRFALFAAIPLAFFLIMGFARLFLRVMQTKMRFTKELLILFVSSGLFASLVFNVVRYPYIERGTLKMIFIVMIIPLLIPYGLAICKWKQMRFLVTINILLYTALMSLAFWV